MKSIHEHTSPKSEANTQTHIGKKFWSHPEEIHPKPGTSRAREAGEVACTPVQCSHTARSHPYRHPALPHPHTVSSCAEIASFKCHQRYVVILGVLPLIQLLFWKRLSLLTHCRPWKSLLSADFRTRQLHPPPSATHPTAAHRQCCNVSFLTVFGAVLSQDLASIHSQAPCVNTTSPFSHSHAFLCMPLRCSQPPCSGAPQAPCG